MEIKTNKYEMHILPKFYNDFEILCLDLNEEKPHMYISRIELLKNEYATDIEAIYIKSNLLWILIKKNVETKKNILKSLDRYTLVESPSFLHNAEVMLILSSLPRYQVKGLHNITGSIYQFVEQKRNSNQLIFLKYNVFNGVMKQTIQTFTKYKIMKKKLRLFVKDNFKITGYDFDDGVLKLSLSLTDDTYVLGNREQVNNHSKRNTVNFFRIAKSKEEFINNKMYYLSKFLKDVNEHLADYINIEDIKRSFNHKAIKNVNKLKSNLIAKESYNIINLSMADNVLFKLEKCLQKAFPEEKLFITHSDKVNKKKLNIILINTKEEYESANIRDPYIKTPDIVTQHVYLHEIESAYEALSNKKECMIGKVILTDAFIKKEIINRKIELYNFNNDYFEGKEFILPIKKKDKIKDGVSLSLKIVNNNLFFKTINFSNLKIKYNFNQEGYIRNGNKLSVVSDTDEILLPDINYVIKKYDLVNNFGRIQRHDVEKCLKEFSHIVYQKSNKKIKEYWDEAILKVKEILDNILDNRLTSNDLRQILSPLKKVIAYGLYGEFINYFYLKHGKLIAPLLSLKSEKEKFLVGFEGINYLIDKNNLYYTVGHTSLNDISANLAKAIKVKKVTNVEESFINNYFDLLDVSFIRYKQATVIPFPFKYIKEFIKMQPDLDFIDADFSFSNNTIFIN